MLKKIFAYVPTAEVFCRILYKDILFKNRIFNKAYNIYRKKKKAVEAPHISVDELIAELSALGVVPGDILIVHSSLDGLHEIDASAKEILEKLMQYLGREGTLVLPAFPYYKEMEAPEKPIKYDPARTLAWTGILPNVFLSMPGTTRSSLPKNSLAANGKFSKEMFDHEMLDDASHGEHSAWNFCAEHHAKVIFLGVSPNHSFSEVHMAEGLMGKSWPIKDWYYLQPYQIKIDGEWQNRKFWVRRYFWTRYMTEEYSTRQAIKAGVLKRCSGMCKAYVPDMNAVKNWLLKKAAENNLIYYKIPRKYWKT